MLRSDGFVLALTGVPVLLFVGRTLRPEAPLYGGALDAEGLLVLGSLSKLALLVAASLWALAVAARFEEGNPMRGAWRLLGLGFLANLLGQLALAPYQLVWREPAPFPSPAELFYLLAYPLLMTALVRFTRAYEEGGFSLEEPARRRRRERLLLLGLGIAAVPALWPVLAAGRPLLETALNLLYPVLDLLLLAPALLLLRVTWRFRGGRVWPVWMALVGGFTCLAAGDVVFGYFSSLGLEHLDSLVDALYVAAYGGMLHAGVRQHRLLAPDVPVPVPEAAAVGVRG